MPNGTPLEQPLLQAIIQAVPCGIVVFDLLGRITFANSFAEQLLSFEPGQWRNTPVDSIFMEDDREIFLPNIIKLTRTQGSFSGEVLLRNRSDRKLFVHLNAHLFREGDTEFIIAAIHDICALKDLQHSSRESDRLLCLGKVVDRMAHHIRNPIAAIGGFASRLLKSGLSDEERRLYQDIIFQESSRLDSLLKSLADFTALPTPAPLQGGMDQVLARAIDLIPETLRARASAWHTPAAGDLQRLRAFMDVELMARSLANVLTNALEAGQTRLDITVQASGNDGQLKVAVIDTGMGITAENLPFVFDPLFTTKYNHVGLGLTISQRIIQEHGGSIDVESEPEQGTTVTMGIPVERRRSIRLRPL
jgi:PAS domain S-box-containing protein